MHKKSSLPDKDRHWNSVESPVKLVTESTNTFVPVVHFLQHLAVNFLSEPEENVWTRAGSETFSFRRAYNCCLESSLPDTQIASPKGYKRWTFENYRPTVYCADAMQWPTKTVARGSLGLLTDHIWVALRNKTQSRVTFTFVELSVVINCELSTKLQSMLEIWEVETKIIDMGALGF